MLNWKDLQNPSSGGAEILTEGILTELVTMGHSVTLFTSAFPGSLPDENVNGYRIIRKGKYWTVQAWAFLYWFREFKRENFDIVIDQIHGIPFFTSLYIRNSVDGTSPKIYAFIHEVAKEIWFKMFKFPLNYIGYWVEKLYFQFYKNVPFITVSKATAADLLEEGIKQDHIAIIPEAIHFHPVTGVEKELHPTIVYLGRLAPMKQVEQLLNAVYIVQKDIPEVKLWLVGRGESTYIAKLKDLASTLAIQPKFQGHVSEDEKQQMLKAAHILSSASVKEGFGLVILEAAAQGTPSVVYNVKGFSEAVIDGETGILTDPTPEALAASIISLFNNQDRYTMLVENAHKYAGQFTFARAAEEFQRIIE